jgi:hypothetical protein
VVGVGDDVVDHAVVNQGGKGVLQIGEGIKVPARGNAMFSGENGMGCVRSHDAGQKE